MKPGVTMLIGSVLASVFSARNTLQFFTIPIGYLTVFGTGKGSGTALLFFVIAIVGVITCLLFRKDPHIWKLEE